MKIMHLITHLGVGGAETVFYNRLLVAKNKGDADQHIICYFYDGIYADKLREAGFVLIKISRLFSLYQCSILIKKEKPDCLHASLWLATVCARLLGYFWKIPVICDIHHDPLFQGKIRTFFDYFLPYRHVTFVAVTSAIVSSIRKGMPGALVCVIHNGVDQKYFLKNSQTCLKNAFLQEEKVIITVCGRLIQLKRYDVFLRVLQAIIASGRTQVHGLIIGDGPEKDALVALAYTLGIERHVTFVGNQKNMPDWYAISDILVSCSETEALSMVVLEAMAAGVVVVATESTNAHEVIVDGKNGIIVSGDVVHGIFYAISRLVDSSSLRNRIKAAAEETVRKHFDIGITEEAYKQLYQSLL